MNQDAKDIQAILNALDKETGRNPYDHELHRRLENACQLYLTATTQEREQLRAFVSGHRNLIHLLAVHVGWCISHVRSAHDREFLRGGIAAISLQDNLGDFRDNYIGLGGLYLVCVNAGIEPSSDFYQIGLLSSANDKKRGGSTRHFLTKFETSAYFAESLAPKLAK